VIAARLAAVRRMLTLLGVSSGQVSLLVVLGAFTAAFEAVGISLLIPLLAYIEQGPRVFEDNRLAAAAASIVAPLGIAPSLPLLFAAAFTPVLLRQVFRYLRQVYANQIRFGALTQMRREGVSALLNADLAFVLDRGHSRLVGTVTTEVERCTTALPIFLLLVEGTLMIAVYLGLLFFVAASLVPVVIVAMIVTGVVIRAQVKRTAQLGRTVAAQGSALQVAISEQLMGFRLVKLRGLEGEEATRFGRLSADLSASHIRIGRMRDALEACTEPVMVAGVFAALYVAVDIVGVGLVRIGALGVIMTRLVPMLQQVNMARLGLAAYIGGLQRIAGQTEDARAHVDRGSAGIPFPGLRHEIVFDGVGFRYDADEDVWALRDVSFSVARGSLTAIVGRSGAGKSTLLDLVPRLRTPARGEIRIDGVPLDRFDLTALRRGIGYVDQEGFLFEGTIAENIAYGVPGATTEAIVDAARRAHVAEFVGRLPDGYATNVGQQGSRLSVGQRQRVCIARILLQDPDILLLDEPTSALDGESEQHIRDVLDDLRRHKAVIVVAHRVSTVRGADQIIVLDHGRVVERGDHEALLAQVGAYAQLFDV
jgi:ABC-type multidrug transport system fused ATPase/permease subunit